MYGNILSVDAGNLNILSSLPEETRLNFLEHKQVKPKVQGFQCRQHSTHTHSLQALILEACATADVRDHANSAGGGVTNKILWNILIQTNTLIDTGEYEKEQMAQRREFDS